MYMKHAGLCDPVGPPRIISTRKKSWPGQARARIKPPATTDFFFLPHVYSHKFLCVVVEHAKSDSFEVVYGLNKHFPLLFLLPADTLNYCGLLI